MCSETLFASLSEYVSTKSLPPVEKWHPQTTSTIDIHIDRSGNWSHEGGAISRISMIRVFSSILRRDGPKYYLVTPEVKLEIQVEDVPFFVSNIETSGEGEDRQVAFVTKTGDYLTLDKNHNLSIEDHGFGAKPYIIVRQKMQALLSRAVYYQMAEYCSMHTDDNRRDPGLGIWSSGTFFRLADGPGTGV